MQEITTETGADISKIEFMKLKTAKMIEFLREKADIDISDRVEKILWDQEIGGKALTNLTQEKLELAGIPMGPAANLSDFVSRLNSQKKRKI